MRKPAGRKRVPSYRPSICSTSFPGWGLYCRKASYTLAASTFKAPQYFTSRQRPAQNTGLQDWISWTPKGAMTYQPLNKALLRASSWLILGFSRDPPPSRPCESIRTRHATEKESATVSRSASMQFGRGTTSSQSGPQLYLSNASN